MHAARQPKVRVRVLYAFIGLPGLSNKGNSQLAQAVLKPLLAAPGFRHVWNARRGHGCSGLMETGRTNVWLREVQPGSMALCLKNTRRENRVVSSSGNPALAPRCIRPSKDPQ